MKIAFAMKFQSGKKIIVGIAIKPKGMMKFQCGKRQIFNNVEYSESYRWIPILGRENMDAKYSSMSARANLVWRHSLII